MTKKRDRFMKFEFFEKTQLQPEAIRLESLELARLELAAKLLLPQGALKAQIVNNEAAQVRDYLQYAVKQIRQRVRARKTQRYVRVTYERGGLVKSAEGPRDNIQALKDKVQQAIQFIRETRRTAMRPTNSAIYADHDGRRPVRRIGFVHTEPGVWLREQKYKKTLVVRKKKIPVAEDSSNYVGIEIEFCCPKNTDDLGDILFGTGLGESIQLKGDGSVRPKEGDHAHELCILAKQDSVSDVVMKATRILKEHGAYVNKSCGLHVHIDMRNRDAKKSWENLRNTQGVLYAMVPVFRKNGEYSRPVRPMDFETARSSTNRYVGINSVSLRTHKTIEIRLHSPTLDAKKILNWVELVTRIADAPKLEKQIRSHSSLVKQVKMPKELAEYVKERVDLFKVEHKGADSADDVLTSTGSPLPPPAAFVPEELVF